MTATTNIAEDERAGLPSASIVPRIEACPGSPRQCVGCPEWSSPDMRSLADAGERIHLWLESPEFCPLNDPDELDIAEQCSSQRDALVRQVFGDASHVIIKEQRLWLHYKDGRKRFSGRIDFNADMDTTALVIDYKTGRGDTEPSPSNLQLRSYAVLKWFNSDRKVSKIWVAIVQPLAGKPVLVPYEGPELAESAKQLDKILDATEAEDAPLRAGKHCKFCPARLTCPACHKMLEDIASIDTEQLGKIPGEAVAAALELCSSAKPVIENIREFAKQKLKLDPTSVPGWQLADTGGNRIVTDPAAVLGALEAAGLMDQETFIKECVSVGIGDLERTVMQRNELKKKEAQNAVFKHCNDFISKKSKQPTLERVE